MHRGISRNSQASLTDTPTARLGRETACFSEEAFDFQRIASWLASYFFLSTGLGLSPFPFMSLSVFLLFIKTLFLWSRGLPFTRGQTGSGRSSDIFASAACSSQAESSLRQSVEKPSASRRLRLVLRNLKRMGAMPEWHEDKPVLGRLPGSTRGPRVDSGGSPESFAPFRNNPAGGPPAGNTRGRACSSNPFGALSVKALTSAIRVGPVAL